MLNVLTKRRGLIGVDIGASCVKVAQLTRRAGRFVLERGVVLDRPPSAANATVETTQFSVNNVGELLHACDHFPGRDAAAVVSMSACEVKSEALEDNLSLQEIAEVASRIAARDSRLPQPLQQDFWQSQVDSKDHMLHVLAMPKQLTQDVARVHRRVGWSCAALDSLPTALARAVHLSEGVDAAPIAAIDWGWSQVTLCVVLRGEALFVRSFPRGALKTIVEPLRQELRLTRREAWQLLSEVGVSGALRDASLANSAATVAKLTSQGMQQFEAEICRTLAYIASRHRTISPERIVLFGGGALVAGIAEHATQTFERQATVWSFPYVDGAGEGDAPFPVPLLGPAIALSALAWGSS